MPDRRPPKPPPADTSEERPGDEEKPEVEVKPVAEKIGEDRENLRNRAAAFKRRRQESS